jgi:hypothetical protein
MKWCRAGPGPLRRHRASGVPSVLLPLFPCVSPASSGIPQHHMSARRCLQDPSYPVYVDTSVMMGMTGQHNGTGFDGIEYMVGRGSGWVVGRGWDAT